MVAQSCAEGKGLFAESVGFSFIDRCQYATGSFPPVGT